MLHIVYTCCGLNIVFMPAVTYSVTFYFMFFLICTKEVEAEESRRGTELQYTAELRLFYIAALRECRGFESSVCIVYYCMLTLLPAVSRKYFIIYLLASNMVE